MCDKLILISWIIQDWIYEIDVLGHADVSSGKYWSALFPAAHYSHDEPATLPVLHEQRPTGVSLETDRMAICVRKGNWMLNVFIHNAGATI